MTDSPTETETQLPRFKQAIISRFWLFFTGCIVIFIIALTLVFQMVVAHQQFQSSRLPNLKKEVQFQQSINSLEKLLSDINQLDSAIELPLLHKQLNQSLKQVVSIHQQKNKSMNEALRKNAMLKTTVTRLAENQQLITAQTSEVTQALTRVNRAISDWLLVKQQQQKRLYKLVRNDRLIDSVTRNRAKAQAELVNDIVDGQILLGQLQQLNRELLQLSIQTPTNQFEKMAELAVKTFSDLALENEAMAKFVTGEVKIDLQFVNTTLFSQSQLIAQWRGQLRLFSQYHDAIVEIQSLIPNWVANTQQRLINQSSSKQHSNQITRLLEPFNQTLSSWYGKLSEQQWFYVLTGLILLVLSLFGLLINRIKDSAQQFVETTESLIKNEVEGNNTRAFHYQEQQQLIAPLSTIVRPEYSLEDVQHIKQQHQRLLTILSRHQQIAVFEILVNELASSQYQKALYQQLCQVLNVEPNGGLSHWRHFFIAPVVIQLIQTARKVRETQQEALVAVKTKTNKTVLITIDSHGENWTIVLANYQHIDALEQQIVTLEQTITIQNKEHLTRQLDYAEQLRKQLIQWRIQLSNHVVNSYQQQGVTFNMTAQYFAQQIENQLNRINHQIQLLTLLLGQLKLSIDNVSFSAMIHAIILNSHHYLLAKNNKLTLRIDENIHEQVVIDSSVFSQFILGLIHQFNALLSDVNIHLTMIAKDKNHGQQTVLFTFKISSNEQSVELPAFFQQLTLIEPKQALNDTLLNDYFKQLLQQFNGENFAVKTMETGFELNFEIPIACADIEVKSTFDEPIKPIPLLLISNKKMLSKLVASLLKSHHVEFDVLASVQQFEQQFSIKRLTKKPLAAVLVAPDIIDAQLNTLQNYCETIPSQSRPKLYVLQQQSAENIQRQGLYQQNISPFFAQPLFHNIVQFLGANQQSNQLISAHQCQQYHFEANYVPVLLAVNSPEQQQPLVNILKWFGFTVTVVSQKDVAKQQVMSDQYVLVISELIIEEVFQQPLVNCRHYFIVPTIESPKIVLPTSSSFACEIFVGLTDLSALVEQLSPWLIQQSKQVDGKNVHKQNKVQQKLREDAHQEKIDQQFTDFAIEKELSQEDDIVESEEFSPSLSIFNLQEIQQDTYSENAMIIDLAQYALHQGSAEMAALMLEDYIEQNQHDLSTLSQAVELLASELSLEQKQEQTQLIESTLSQLYKTALILSAPLLLETIVAFQLAFKAQQVEQYADLLNKMLANNEQLADYACAI